ncbi:MAG: hypothetical protein ACI9K5_003575 [Gammaproteobacteria bacterium]
MVTPRPSLWTGRGSRPRRCPAGGRKSLHGLRLGADALNGQHGDSQDSSALTNAYANAESKDHVASISSADGSPWHDQEVAPRHPGDTHVDFNFAPGVRTLPARISTHHSPPCGESCLAPCTRNRRVPEGHQRWRLTASNGPRYGVADVALPVRRGPTFNRSLFVG